MPQMAEAADETLREPVSFSTTTASSRASSWLAGQSQRATVSRVPLPGMVAINLRLPPEIHEELKILAFNGRTSLQKLIIEAIEAKLQEMR
jgi:predicted HicB family RNase H-like nuclease